MAVGPFLVDLSGATLDNGTPAQLTAASLPAGTYREVRFKIHRPQSSESDATAVAGMQDLISAGASIIVDGTIDSVPFSFTTPMDVEQRLEGNFVLGANSNLTLNVDPSTWFGTSGSGRLDPRQSSVRSQIEGNIQRSFKAFRDDNKDGHEDD